MHNYGSLYTLDSAARTSIAINDTLIKEALARSGLPAKRAADEDGLRLLIGLANRNAAQDLRGKIRWVGNLDAMGGGRHAVLPAEAWKTDEDEPE